jgi:hypothetical protein
LCRAAILLGASEKLQEISSTALLLIRREDFERVIAKTRAQLDEVKFTEAWTQGREMLADQILAYSLSNNMEASDNSL